MRPVHRSVLMPLLLVAGLTACADDEAQAPPSAASSSPAVSSADPSATSPSPSPSATSPSAASPTSPPAPATVSPQRSAYVEQANAICSDATDQLLKLRPPVVPEDLPGLLEQTLEINDSTLSKIEQLRAPPGDADRLQAEFLDKAREQEQEVETILRDVRAAVEAKNEEQLQAAGQRLREISDPEMRTFLGDYGLTACRDLGRTGGS